MRFYHMTDAQALRVPVRRFMVLYRQIPKLKAQDALLQIQVISAAVAGGDGAQTFLSGLKAAALGDQQAERPRPVADLASMGLGGD
ncbi:MAG: hypothetical protein ACM3VX_09795 [Bacteroidota bacterium]